MRSAPGLEFLAVNIFLPLRVQSPSSASAALENCVGAKYLRTRTRVYLCVQGVASTRSSTAPPETLPGRVLRLMHVSQGYWAIRRKHASRRQGKLFRPLWYYHLPGVLEALHPRHLDTSSSSLCVQLQPLQLTFNAITPTPTQLDSLPIPSASHTPFGRLRVSLLYTPIRCKLSSNQHPRRQSVSTSSKTMADSGNAPKPSSSVKLVLLGEAAVGKVDLILSRRHPALLHYANCRASVLVGPSIRQQRLPGEQGAHYWRSVDPSSTEQ